MNWYVEVLKKYAVFSGRARRKEYWTFFLVNSIIFVIFFIVGVFGDPSGIEGMLGGLYSLGVFVPLIAVSVRRLHDTNRSGWWYLISFVPLVGAIVLLVFTVQDSQEGDNKYGPNPKAATAG